MKKYISAIIFACLSALALATELPIVHSDKEFTTLTEKPTLIYMYSDECKYCNTFDPIFDRMAQANSTLKMYRAKGVKQPWLEERLDVRGYPSYYMVEKGNILRQGSGLINDQELQDFIDAQDTRSRVKRAIEAARLKALAEQNTPAR